MTSPSAIGRLIQQVTDGPAWMTVDAGSAGDGSIMFHLPATRIGGDTTKMMKKIAICALIALVLVPAGVMAVKVGGNSIGAGSTRSEPVAAG